MGEAKIRNSGSCLFMLSPYIWYPLPAALCFLLSVLAQTGSGSDAGAKHFPIAAQCTPEPEPGAGPSLGDTCVFQGGALQGGGGTL